MFASIIWWWRFIGWVLGTAHMPMRIGFTAFLFTIHAYISWAWAFTSAFWFRYNLIAKVNRNHLFFQPVEKITWRYDFYLGWSPHPAICDSFCKFFKFMYESISTTKDQSM